MLDITDTCGDAIHCLSTASCASRVYPRLYKDAWAVRDTMNRVSTDDTDDFGGT